MQKLAMTASALLLAAGVSAADRFVSPDGNFSIDALEALGRVSDPALSPDGKSVLFGIAYEDLADNSSNNDLYTLSLNVKNAVPVRITDTSKSESGAVWIDGGKRIAFMYPDADGKPQMWTMAANGSDRVQATDHEGGIAGFLLSPDQT